jgi:hypothetical protein
MNLRSTIHPKPTELNDPEYAARAADTLTHAAEAARLMHNSHLISPNAQSTESFYAFKQIAKSVNNRSVGSREEFMDLDPISQETVLLFVKPRIAKGLKRLLVAQRIVDEIPLLVQNDESPTPTLVDVFFSARPTLCNNPVLIKATIYLQVCLDDLDLLRSKAFDPTRTLLRYLFEILSKPRSCDSHSHQLNYKHGTQMMDELNVDRRIDLFTRDDSDFTYAHMAVAVHYVNWLDMETSEIAYKYLRLFRGISPLYLNTLASLTKMQQPVHLLVNGDYVELWYNRFMDAWPDASPMHVQKFMNAHLKVDFPKNLPVNLFLL